MKNWPSIMSRSLPMRSRTPTSDDEEFALIHHPETTITRAATTTPPSSVPLAAAEPPPPASWIRAIHDARVIRHADGTETEESPRSSKPRPPLAANRSNDDFKPIDFAKPFCRFLTRNPTVFHAVDAIGRLLEKHGYTKLSERDLWKLERGGKYYVERNGSSLIAFAVGTAYEAGNGVAMIAGHVDALTAKVKPVPGLKTTEGFVQLGMEAAVKCPHAC